MALPQSGSQAVSGYTPILQAIPVIGGVLQSIAGAVASLAKGKTTHFAYSEVLGVSQQGATEIFNALKTQFTDEQLMEVASFVPRHFKDAMTSTWGFGPSLNQVILNDVTQNAQGYPLGSHALYRQLMNFFIWVWTNIDQHRPETFGQFAQQLFADIFVPSFQDAGLPGVKETVTQVIQGQTGGVQPPVSGTTVSSAQVTSAGITPTVLIAVIAIAVVFTLFQKK
jgi:hypothetical protein